MSTGGQAIGGVLGAVGGFFVAGPKGALYGAQIGIAIGGYLDPPKGPVNQGPRLSDLSVATATYGAFIPRGYGTFPVVGNIFWLENNQLKETQRKETSSGGKGGGPKTTTTTFSYSATFAVGLLDCTDGTPIAGIRRIWLGNRLFYDAGATDLATIIASNQASSVFTLHTGSASQLADSRMQATLGVANTPAYRGLAYIVFNDLQLAPYNNSLVGVQVKVEIVKAGYSTKFPLISQFISSPKSLGTYGYAYTYIGCHISMDLVRVFNPAWDSTLTTGLTYAKHDNRLGAMSVITGLPAGVTGYPVPARMLSDNPDRFWPDSTPYFSVSLYSGSANLVEDGDLLFACNRTMIGVIVKGALPALEKSVTNLTRLGTTDGSFCYTLETNTSTGVLGYIRKYDASLNQVAVMTVPSVIDGYPVYHVGENLLCPYGGFLWYFDGPSSATCKVFKFSLDALTATFEGTIDGSPTTGTYFNIYIKIIDGIIISARPNSVSETIDVRYYSIDRLSTSSVTLASVVSPECLKSALLTASDIDVSLLTSLVKGYRTTSISSIRSAIEPLQGAWPFDVVPHGYKIQFKPRGSASVATIAASELDARGIGEAPGVSITNSREMDSVLPRRVVLSYLDVEREYDSGQQYAERLNTEAVNVSEISLALVMSSDEAAKTAETLLYLYWLERYDLTFALPPSRGALEPGDVIVVNANEATYRLRLTSITYTSDGRVECAAKYDSTAVYTAAAVGAAGASTGVALKLSGDSRMALLDIPTLADDLNTAGFPMAMTGYLAGWPGGVLFRSDDNGQTWVDVQGISSPGATMGVASNALGAVGTALIDKSSTLAVNFYGPAPSSVSELSMFNGANHFAYGAHGRWEIIAAQTCTLQGDGSYVLTNLLRGRAGTEWAMSTHVSGDEVIALDTSLSFLTSNTNSIGLARSYQAVTEGRAISSSASDQVAFTYSAVNLEPLSPVYLNGNRHPTTNDWTLTWIRRTRIGGAWRDLVDASLGEASELYDVEIYSSGAYTTLKRTFSSLTSATTPYTSAQQVTDFGSNQATLYVKIYQLSATVGRGNPLITSITR